MYSEYIANILATRLAVRAVERQCGRPAVSDLRRTWDGQIPLANARARQKLFYGDIWWLEPIKLTKLLRKLPFWLYLAQHAFYMVSIGFSMVFFISTILIYSFVQIKCTDSKWLYTTLRAASDLWFDLKWPPGGGIWLREGPIPATHSTFDLWRDIVGVCSY